MSRLLQPRRGAILRGKARAVVMRIGIDAFPAMETPGGIGTYVRHLLPALAALETGDELIAYVPPPGAVRTGSPAQGLSLGMPCRSTSRAMLRWRGRRDGLDLYHGTNFKFHARGRYGAIVTIHDLWLDRYPQHGRKLLGQGISRLRARWRLRDAARIIADSRHTAQDLQEVYGVPGERVIVVYPGTPGEFFEAPAGDRLPGVRKRYGLDDRPYLLFVGGATPRKNHRVALQAFDRLAEVKKDTALVIVGDPDHRGRSIHDTVRELNLEKQVHCVGRVPTEDLKVLYARAALLVFPSLYEGFGFPVLEAMACGTPVLASNRSSLPEVAGDAAVLVNPDAPEELAEAIRRILTDTALRRSLRQKGLARAKEFNWETTARQTLDVYRAACGIG